MIGIIFGNNSGYVKKFSFIYRSSILPLTYYHVINHLFSQFGQQRELLLHWQRERSCIYRHRHQLPRNGKADEATWIEHEKSESHFYFA